MSPIALGLDLLLAGLLVAALIVGARLNARLKALREGQAGFARAIAELNEAAGRAEAGLASLRAASEETHDALLTRIETARGLIARLDRATLEAERSSPARVAAGPELLRAVSGASAAARGQPGTHPAVSASTVPAAPSPSRSSPPKASPPRASPPRASPASASRRVSSDDDLFEPGADAATRPIPLARDPGRQEGDRR